MSLVLEHHLAMFGVYVCRVDFSLTEDEVNNTMQLDVAVFKYVYFKCITRIFWIVW